MNNFINFHILISHSPSCLNRDDMNMQKDAVFGGKRRVRISSQSLKRTIRKSEYYARHLGESSVRTRKLELLADTLTQKINEGEDQAVEKCWIDKTIQLFVSRVVDNEEESEDEEMSGDSDAPVKSKKTAVAPWSVEEFRIVCGMVQDIYQSPLAEKEEENLAKAIEKEQKRKVSKTKPRKSDEEVKDEFLTKIVMKRMKENICAIQGALNKTLDIALSGRMATSGLMTTIDGAMSVAHSITTHAVESGIDWFTAVDDLDSQGSGHLDTQEFSSGVFYRYASLNISQLQENLGSVDRSKVLEIASHLAHMLATETPNAKQRTFAAFNPADLVMVNFSDFPLSLANAFECPVKAKEGYLKPSIEAFTEYWERVSKGYGLTGPAAEFLLTGDSLPAGVAKMESLEQLKQWIRNSGEV
ncbi:type I-E CRISPR-associated protein Cas7/Cse4/CasC [Citrobacter braakii]|uniref:type I-E CRISPR-associated protein Cas7/Cse4/CasC n=1 Tax=Citrobacter braakii TaxID=57706 RepID=UPI00129983EB|nr:type I-E CRISPR-associated protein Cas7/Cse4/CasC [Citrobacter braakii]MEB8065346.1 type I-E CRISPR-associated protein Cas7/Cse4/CasC [Citrobacter braakii]MRE80711.1 type I-E CRISPR-associated protein Cas7/Cse4/CasC [Citrobacter braakii]